MTGERSYPVTEQEFLEDNIATVAFHLGQPGARLSVSHDGPGLVVDPGEVLKEISRRLSGAAQPPLGPCTQAELDTFEKHLDRKDAQLLLMWVDRAMKAEAALTQGVQVPEGFALLPIEPTSMMALRGYQAGNVFDENDTFSDYIDAAEYPKELAPKHRFEDDERGWMLAAAAYRGCVAGYLETLRRLEKDPADQVAISWNNPIRSPSVPSTQSEGGK